MISWILPCCIGIATGILSGFGVGGGSLLLIYLTTFATIGQHEAQAINLVYFLPAALAALPAHRKNGFLETRTAGYAILGGLVCTVIAALISNRLDVSLLRKLFGVFLLLIGLRELFYRDPEQ